MRLHLRDIRRCAGKNQRRKAEGRKAEQRFHTQKRRDVVYLPTDIHSSFVNKPLLSGPLARLARSLSTPPSLVPPPSRKFTRLVSVSCNHRLRMPISAAVATWLQRAPHVLHHHHDHLQLHHHHHHHHQLSVTLGHIQTLTNSRHGKGFSGSRASQFPLTSLCP